MNYDLLPQNATEFERAFSLATDESARLSPGISSIRTAKLVSIPESFLPFLIYEYGLGEISAYAANRRDLIVRGRDWQRVRGTPEALALGLDMIDFSARLEEAPSRRARWNLFYLELNRIPPTETDLENIEGLASLSVPVRSHFWRGFRGYDVRPLEWSRKRWSGGAWSSSSGVRIRDGGAKWSFGRAYDSRIPVGQSTLEDLDAWVPASGTSIGWVGSSWDDVGGSSWVDLSASDRISAITAALVGRPVYVALRDEGGDLIGYRRARAVHRVSQSDAGRYAVGNARLEPDNDAPSGLYIEAMTDFGDGAGRAVASVSLVWDLASTDPGTPGLMWGGAADLSGGVEVLSRPAEIQLGRTVRERFRFFLTF